MPRISLKSGQSPRPQIGIREMLILCWMQANTKLPTIGTLLATWVIKLSILPITQPPLQWAGHGDASRPVTMSASSLLDSPRSWCGCLDIEGKCPLLCPQNTDTDEKAEEGGAAEAGQTEDDGLQNTPSGKIKNTQISRTPGRNSVCYGGPRGAQNNELKLRETRERETKVSGPRLKCSLFWISCIMGIIRPWYPCSQLACQGTFLVPLQIIRSPEPQKCWWNLDKFPNKKPLGTGSPGPDEEASNPLFLRLGAIKICFHDISSVVLSIHLIVLCEYFMLYTWG